MAIVPCSNRELTPIECLLCVTHLSQYIGCIIHLTVPASVSLLVKGSKTVPYQAGTVLLSFTNKESEP